MTIDALSRYVNGRLGGFSRHDWLKPMDGNEILNTSAKVLHLFGRMFLRYSLVPAVFCTFSTYFFFSFVMERLFTTTNNTDFWTQIADVGFALLIAFLVAVPLMFIGVTIISLIVAHIVGNFIVGRSINDLQIRDILVRCGLKSFLGSIVIMLRASAGFIVAIGLFVLSAILDKNNSQSSADLLISGTAILAIVATVFGFGYGLYSAGRAFLLYPIAVHENVYGVAAFRRAKELMKPTKGTGLDQPHSSLFSLTVLTFFTLVLIGSGVASVAGMLNIDRLINELATYVPFSDIWVAFISMLPIYASILLIFPVYAATSTLLYFERRVRREGFDIKVLAMEAVRAAQKKTRFSV